MRKKSKLVEGVGINDANYNVTDWEYIGFKEDGKPLKRLIWTCPYYITWKSMLGRCYNIKFQERHPTYIGCYVCDEWLLFSNFKVWMETQEWEGKELDKDLLFKGNTVYNPNTCVFISSKINSFLIERGADRGEYPIGVCYMKKQKNMVNEHDKPYIAQIGDSSGKAKYLGCFATPEEAHAAWLTAKLEQAKILAAEQTDPRVAKALIERYENYGN